MYQATYLFTLTLQLYYTAQDFIMYTHFTNVITDLAEAI